MVKFLFLLFPILLSSISAQVQIPNGDFELWEPILNFEEPVDWNTNNDSLHVRVEKDTIAFDGKYSLKFISAEASSWQGCESRTTLHAEFNSPIPSNSSLVFYLKSVPLDPNIDSSVYFWIIANARDSNSLVNTYSWYTFTPLEEFTKIEIPITDGNIIILNLIIFGGASTNPTDGPCIGRSFSWIDGMSVESTTAIKDSPTHERSEVSIFPNPSTGLVSIDYPIGHICGYELYSLIGELISTGEVFNNQLRIQERGIYILKLMTNDVNRKVFFQKILIQK